MLNYTYVLVHINMMILRFFVQLPISFPVLLCHSLVDMCPSLGASLVLILSYVLDRRELSLRKHKLENLFFFTCLWSPRRKLLLFFGFAFSLFKFQRYCSFRLVYLVPLIVRLCLHNPFRSVFKYWCCIIYPTYFHFIRASLFFSKFKVSVI